MKTVCEELWLEKIFRPYEDKLIYLQKYWRYYRDKVPRVMFRQVRIYACLQKVFEIVPKYEDLPVTFNRLKKLSFLKRSMTDRIKLRIKRDVKLKQREMQRVKTENTKLNFVSGIMNRFFAEFLKSHCSKGIKATATFGISKP